MVWYGRVGTQRNTVPAVTTLTPTPFLSSQQQTTTITHVQDVSQIESNRGCIGGLRERERRQV